MLSLITALLLLLPPTWVSLAQQLHPKPLSKTKEPSVKSRKANPQGEKTASDQAVKSPNVVCNGCPIKEPASAQKGAQDQSCAPNGLYRAYLCATIVGVGIGLAGLGFIYWQIRIARRTADAAKASADALVNIERPWLLYLMLITLLKCTHRVSLRKWVPCGSSRTLARLQLLSKPFWGIWK
jgi:hypothetical protein